MFNFSCRTAIYVLLLLVSLVAGPTGMSFAQDTAPAQTTPAAKIEELLRLMDDPDVRAALEAGRGQKAAQPDVPITAEIGRADEALRRHLASMAAAARRLPQELSDAAQTLSRAAGPGETGLIMLLLIVLVPAVLAEWLVRRNMESLDFANTRLGVFNHQLFSKFAPLLAFAVIGVVLFLAVGSSPLLRKIVGIYLVALIVARLVYAVMMLLVERAQLAPPEQVEQPVLEDGAQEPEMAQVQAQQVEEQAQPAGVDDAVVAEAQASPSEEATDEELVATDKKAEETVPSLEALKIFWKRRIAVTVGYFIAAWATLGVLPLLGVSQDVQQLLTYVAGIVLLIVAIEVVWCMPRESSERFASRPAKWMLTIYMALLWCVWAAGATVPFWIGLYVLILPRLLRVVGKASQSFLKTADEQGAAPSIKSVLIARGARALVILLAVAWIAFILRMNPDTLATADDVTSRIVRSLLRAVLILVAADLVWQFIKSWIDARITADGPTAEQPTTSRLRTLLPIFRNALAVLVMTIAGLMILAESGVQIGPLIAGAGIFGVAIGFGSQTLVKDIVSGIFYLMDDAFRVGEYIQSGSYKGTVEGFSLRSIRLRHHRGPVFTVPFGSLGAVQNMSRDWVIDKFIVRFPFDTSVKTVKKLTKTIGAELQQDAELGPIILQTVKMKGVEQIGDYGIDVSFAFMTKPGYQTMVRRRAYSMMTDTFAANGIEFARPSVNVGGEDKHQAAGAVSAIVAQQKAAEQAPA